MQTLFWDASALAKRYIAEQGSDTVDALFEARSQHSMVATVLGFVETYAMIVRKRNAGSMSGLTFDQTWLALWTEVLDGPGFAVLDPAVVSPEDARVLVGK
jgi:predicted nucleic acid-binding protein